MFVFSRQYLGLCSSQFKSHNQLNSNFKQRTSDCRLEQNRHFDSFLSTMFSLDSNKVYVKGRTISDSKNMADFAPYFSCKNLTVPAVGKKRERTNVLYNRNSIVDRKAIEATIATSKWPIQ